MELAVAVGAKVALDLASFEVVRHFRDNLVPLLRSGRIECCFGNEVRMHAPLRYPCLHACLSP